MLTDWIHQHLSDPTWDLLFVQTVGLFFALLGVGYGLFELGHLRRQQKVSTDATTSALYGQVSEAMYRVNSQFRERPEWLKYFYFDMRPPKRLSAEMEVTCELIMDFVDAVVEQKRALPPDVSMDWSTWEAYFRSMYQSSPTLRDYVDRNLDYYPDYLFAALGHVMVREPSSGRLHSQWAVHEFDEDNEDDTAVLTGVMDAWPRLNWAPKEKSKRAFPWARIWIIKEIANGGDLSDGRTQKKPVVIAASEGLASDRCHVLIRWLPTDMWRIEVDRELEALERWVLTTVEGTGIRKVRFELPTITRNYSLRRRKKLRGTASFRLPDYHRTLGTFLIELARRHSKPRLEASEAESTKTPPTDAAVPMPAPASGS